MKIMNKNLKPGMVLTNGIEIVAVSPTSWKGEVCVDYLIGEKHVSSIWSAKAYKSVKKF